MSKVVLFKQLYWEGSVKKKYIKSKVFVLSLKDWIINHGQPSYDSVIIYMLYIIPEPPHK